MKRLLLALTVVFAVAGLTACNKPAPDVAPAQAAFDAAKAGGVDPANADMKAADDSLTAAKAEIDKQNKKFSMMRDYKAAAGMLAAAQSSAEKALSDKKAADEAAAKAAAEKAAAMKAKKAPRKGGKMKKKM